MTIAVFHSFVFHDTVFFTCVGILHEFELDALFLK